MVSWLTGVSLHDHNCGMKAYRAEIFREVRLYGELHRFIPVLAAARGFRVGEIEINHRPRRFGHSKYGVRRFVKGFLDLLTVKFLTGFGQRPQHLLGTLGLVSFLLGNVGLLYLAVTWLIRLWYPDLFLPLHERPLLIYSLGALLMGAQMMSIGFLAELITAYQGRDEDSYSIVEQTPPTFQRRPNRLPASLRPISGNRHGPKSDPPATPNSAFRMTPPPDTRAADRRTVYGLLIVLAAGVAGGRILSAERLNEPSVHRAEGDTSTPRPVWPAHRPDPWPTFSSNDRSRWAVVRAGR